MRFSKVSILTITLMTAGVAQAGWDLLNVTVNTDNGLIDISMSNERTACAVGAWKPGGSTNSEGVILCTQNGGESWSTAKLDGMLNIPVAVSMVDEQIGYLASMSFINPKIYRTDNAGRSWTEQSLPDGSGVLLDIFFTDQDHGWAVGGSLAFYTSDGGTSWNAASLPSLTNERGLNGVFFVDNSHGWAVGGVAEVEGDEFTDPVPAHDGFILHSDDGGQSWQMASEGYAGTLNRIWFSDSQHGWAAGGGEAGLILHSSNGGQQWTEQNVPSGGYGAADYVADITFVDNLTGYAVGNIGEGTPMVLLTEDGGANWTVDATYESAFDGLTGMDAFAKWSVLLAVSFPIAGRGMICGENMVIVGFSGQGFCQDFDGDGHQDESCGGDDCDDHNQYVYTGAEELCNGLDENCDDIPDESFDFTRDPKNCGECGFNCQPAQVCWDSICTLDCPAELTRCDQECVELDSNPDHCGACDQPCEYANASGICLSTSCQMGECDSGWIDLDSSQANGCEYECTPSGIETCDGADNDCNGQIDEGLVGCSSEEQGSNPDGGTSDGGSSGADIRQYEPGSSGCSHTKPTGGLLICLLVMLTGYLVHRRKNNKSFISG
jgi:photosystem II stability/assembly factor-like uncharacterized protein